MKNHPPLPPSLRQQRQRLYTRRQLLIRAAGGSVALLFGLPGGVRAQAEDDTWQVIAAVQQQLFPDEPQAPGAQAINALGYLKGVLLDPKVAQEDRDFILQGVGWLQQLARQQDPRGFLALNGPAQAALLQQISRSEAGENWLATLLTYIFEALLTAPAYGGNPGGIGWKWLQYIPGFPLPDSETVHTRLPK